MSITPEQLAGASEESQQKAFFCWCSQNLHRFPELRWMHAIPNGGSRHKAEAANMVAAGVRSGVLDTHLPVPRRHYHGFMMEFKKPGEIKKTTDRQDAYILFLRENNYFAVVVDDWQLAAEFVEWYLS